MIHPHPSDPFNGSIQPPIPCTCIVPFFLPAPLILCTFHRLRLRCFQCRAPYACRGHSASLPVPLPQPFLLHILRSPASASPISRERLHSEIWHSPTFSPSTACKLFGQTLSAFGHFQTMGRPRSLYRCVALAVTRRSATRSQPRTYSQHSQLTVGTTINVVPNTSPTTMSGW